MTYDQQIIKHLLDIEAVQIKPDRSFTWTSGIKSPIYCDNRLTMSYPKVRQLITAGFVDKLNDIKESLDGVSGCATAGIPHAAWLSQQLDLPMSYVRGSAKKHGKQNQIEGIINPGDKIVVIEDLISTGGSVIETVKAIEAKGAHVVKVLAIFSYGLKKSEKAFEALGTPYETLATFDQLIDYLLDENSITADEYNDLLKWRDEL